MKYINKIGIPTPNILITDGIRLTENNNRRYERGESISIDRNIYGHKDVKDSLRNLQNHKCCYCESRITQITYGDVEHIRPKGAYKQHLGDSKNKPGYYWLAYEWNNLLLSCEICNRTYKIDHYPLVNPGTRCTSHLMDLMQEEALLIDPSIENPDDHISFRKEIMYPKTRKGKVTIKYIGLNRANLNEDRSSKLDLISKLEFAHKKYPHDDELKRVFYDTLRDSIIKNGEYSKMIEINFASYLPNL